MISGQEKNLPKEVKSCDGKKSSSGISQEKVSGKKEEKENENEADAETERQTERESDNVWEEENEKE